MRHRGIRSEELLRLGILGSICGVLVCGIMYNVQRVSLSHVGLRVSDSGLHRGGLGGFCTTPDKWEASIPFFFLPYLRTSMALGWGRKARHRNRPSWNRAIDLRWYSAGRLDLQ